MIGNSITTVVKAVRLRYAVLFVLLLLVLYWASIQPWMANWGATAAEQQMALPGDESYPAPAGQSTRAITINAPANVVWQWLAQVGQDRAGFYSYTWLENLIGANIHNANEIHPEWQTVGIGWRGAPPTYLWGLGEGAVFRVLSSEPGRVLIVEMFGAHVIAPIDAHTSRLIVRGESTSANLITKLVWAPVVSTMERRMLLGLKARAEGRPDAPAALMMLAQLGWAAAGIGVVGLFASLGRRGVWLVLPLAATLPALLTSHDLQAGLAAFLAVGITLLGFLCFGRSWWGALLVLGALVLLTLLLASEAYVATGLAFALCSLASLGVTAASRSSRARASAVKAADDAQQVRYAAK